MTASSESVPASAAPQPQPQTGRPPSSLRFDWLMLGVSFWPMAGAATDAWAHINLPGLETFFTPWHALLYSGLLAVGACNALVVARNHARGYAWTRAIAPGYGLTLVGVGVLAVAGAADLTWHLLFGIERDIGATVSPTHLLIICGMVLILAGPLRSALARPANQPLTGLAQLPLFLSALLTYSMLSLVLQFANPFVFHWAAAGDVDLFAGQPYPVDPFLPQSLGVASVVIQSAVLMGFVLVLVRRWRLFPGALTLFLTANIALLSLLNGSFDLLPAAVGTGLAGDILLRVLRPSATRIAALRVFAFVLPALLYTAYYLNLLATEGLRWIIHLSVGTIGVAGAVGLGVSLLLVGAPPAEQTAPSAA